MTGSAAEFVRVATSDGAADGHFVELTRAQRAALVAALQAADDKQHVGLLLDKVRGPFLYVSTA